MNTLNDYKVGDILNITTKDQKGEQTHRVVVFCMNYNGNGYVTFSGTTMGQGAFKPEGIGKDQYGYMKVEKIGWERPWIPFTPRQGDPAYDLMHNPRECG